MDTVGDFIFTVNDRIGNVSVSPDSVPLSLLAEFAKDVEHFIKGSSKSAASGELTVAIVTGSFGLQPKALPPDESFARDVGLLDRQDSLDLMDPKRRKVVEKWQAHARRYPGRVYVIGDRSSGKVVRISKDTRFRSTAAAAWVDVERFLVGEVEDLGGSSTANVHIRVDGKVVVVAATVEALRTIKTNLLYKVSILHIKAQENIENGELRDATLISAEPFEPQFDPDKYEQAKKNAEGAWEGIGDAAAWVRELRGD